MRTSPVTTLHTNETARRLRMSGHAAGRVVAYQKRRGVRFGQAVEAFRVLRSQLMLRWFEQGHKSLAIVGPRRAAGCSTVAANLAISFTELGERTLLIDANFHSPCQHALFGIATDMGLADVLLRHTALERALVSIPEFNHLAVLGTGPIPLNPQELLGSQAWNEMLAGASALFDVVLIDVAPALDFADAQIVTARAGGCVLVARRGRTQVADVNATAARFAPGGARTLGLVIND